MNNVYFENVIGIGDLYLDYIFYEFEYEPILFTCVDGKSNLYLCICSDIRCGQKWIITKCTITALKELIAEQMDIATVFLMNERFIVIKMDLEGRETSTVITRDQMDRLDLPKEGTCIRCDSSKARDYLWGKELKNAYQRINESMNLSQMAIGSIHNFHSVILEILSNYASKPANEVMKSAESINEISRESMMSSYQYSIDTVEKYGEKIESVDVGFMDNDGYIQAA